MIKAILSDKLEPQDFPGYLLVNSVKGLSGYSGSLDALVVHSFSETPDEVNRLLTSLRGTSLFYISSAPNPLVQVIVHGLGGVFLPDDFFLSSEANLDYVVQDFKEESLSSLEISSDIRVLRALEQEDFSHITPATRGLITNSIDHLSATFSQVAQGTKGSSEAAVEIFRQGESLLKQFQEKLAAHVQNEESRGANALAASALGIQFYPRVSISSSKKIIRIKSIGGMKYLTSFSLGLFNYLSLHLNKRPRLVFVESNSEIIKGRYKDFTWVSSSTANMDEEYNSPVVFTSTPTDTVMKRLVDNSLFDIIVVVDRINNSKEHILRIDGSPAPFYAEDGTTVPKSFRLPSDRCFTSASDTPGFLFSVLTQQPYPASEDARISRYLQVCAPHFQRLLS